jgi:hypothetical protein
MPASWKRLGLVDVVAWALNDGYMVEPDLSEQLGRVLTKDLMGKLKEGNDPQKREHEEIHELLSKLVFQSQDGRPRPVSSAMAKYPSSDSESPRGPVM